MPGTKRWIQWPPPNLTPRIGFGGDYNPEQWSEDVWREDVKLMRLAGVNLVSVGIFSWGLLERSDGIYEFDWLDRVLDLLGHNGIAVDLATATASPPAWLVHAHPEILPTDEYGHTLAFGSRQSWCPSSPIFRHYSVRLTSTIATRYASHPALAMWHISNELGCHNSRCFCDISAAAFRLWLTHKYNDNIEALNDAWGTAFWSQRYNDFEQIQPPRLSPTHPNPGQQLDFARFSSDALLEQFTAEATAIRTITPDIPLTTNFMVTGLPAPAAKNMDYATWATHMDLVANDHYTGELDSAPHIEMALSADIVRGIGAGHPWMLMEHSTSAVNWGQVNRPKKPGELRRHSLCNVARGADAICFFQWRASKAGAEKFHSAMLPHAGPNTRVFTEVRRLGSDLQSLAKVATSTVQSEAAMLFDWPSWWASELDSHPSQQFNYRATVLAHYASLWQAGITTDVVPIHADLSKYRLLIVPALYMVDNDTAGRITDFADAGGTVVVTYFSGVVDTQDHVRLGGYPGAFRDLLGIRVEEFGPLPAGVAVALENGELATNWTEDLATIDAETITTYVDGPFPGRPAITRRPSPHGGSAWYVATQLDPSSLTALFSRICTEIDLRPPAAADGSVENVRRKGSHGASFLFLLNHDALPAVVSSSGTDLLTGTIHSSGSINVPPGEVMVIEEDLISRSTPSVITGPAAPRAET